LRVPLLAASGGGLVAVVVTTFSSRRFRVFLIALAYTAVLAWLCLAPVGIVGLALGRPVLLVVPASYHSWVPVRDGTGVCSFPTWRCVRGPGWFCLWALNLVESSSAHLSVCASRRLREPACGMAFTGAGLLLVEPVEDVPALLAAPLLLGCVLWLLCVWPCVPVRCALDAELSRCFMCGVASPVERCDTCLRLLSAWGRLVVNSSEVQLEFFSVGSSGSEVSPGLRSRTSSYTKLDFAYDEEIRHVSIRGRPESGQKKRSGKKEELREHSRIALSRKKRKQRK
ncbi:hypothetical protein Taro_054175, partial [Colocasia esculenta]|nr:hypothetical protein [Colocasia esculenta]